MNKEISLNEKEKNVLDFLIKNETFIKDLINKQKIQGFSLREEVKNLKDTKQTTERISKDYLKSLKAFADKNDCKKVDIMNMAILEFLEKYGDSSSNINSFNSKNFILENKILSEPTITLVKNAKWKNVNDLKNQFENILKQEYGKSQIVLHILIINILLEKDLKALINENNLSNNLVALITDKEVQETVTCIR